MFVTRPPFYLEDTIDSTVISWIDTLAIDGIVLQARFITDQIRQSGVPLIALDANTNLQARTLSNCYATCLLFGVALPTSAAITALSLCRRP
jgi:hypothetical protein